ncbi:MAG: PAS domain S-box protein, partial [Deltaproteobacteria bacterium]|nr:PAS domain S-box protein [Deltaproteobacteria bacterium]
PLAALVPPEDVEKSEALARQLIGGNRQLYTVEHRYQTKAGEPLWARTTATMVRDERGRPLYGLVMVEDISERRRLDQLKDEFISIVSHELRTPLATVTGAIDNMQSGVLGPLTDKQQHYVDLISRNAERLNKIIHGLLDLSRLESGRARVDRRQVSLPPLLREAIQSARLQTAGRVTLEESIPEGLPAVHIDPDLMNEVFANLLDNAARYARSRIVVRAEPFDGQESVRISVHDDGPGIPQEDLCRLFNKFEQIRRPVGSGYKGTGLGLPICKEIVALHAGKIWAESTVGAGTTFHLLLPQGAGGEAGGERNAA